MHASHLEPEYQLAAARVDILLAEVERTDRLSIQDVGLFMTWQKTHAHQFTDPAAAERFCNQVEGRWVRHPSVNHSRGYPVELITNTAGCYVMNFDAAKLLP